MMRMFASFIPARVRFGAFLLLAAATPFVTPASAQTTISWANPATVSQSTISSTAGSPNLVAPSAIWAVGDLIYFTGTSVSSNPFGTTAARYYVTYVSGTTFRVSTTYNGAAVNAVNTTTASTANQHPDWLTGGNWTGGTAPNANTVFAGFPGAGGGNTPPGGIVINNSVTVYGIGWVNSSQDLALFSGSSGSVLYALTFATADSTTPKITCTNASGGVVFLGHNSQAAALKINGTQGLIFNAGPGGSITSGSGVTAVSTAPAKDIRVYNTVDWSGFSGAIQIERGQISQQNGASVLPTNSSLTIGNAQTTANNLLAGLELNGRDCTVDALNGTSFGRIYCGSAQSIFKVGNNNGSGTYPGSIGFKFDGTASAGSIWLHKAGNGTQTISGPFGPGPGTNTVSVDAGTLILSGTNTYSGLTTVSAGATLLVDGEHNQMATGARYIVNATGTLGGTGTLKLNDTSASLTGLSIAGVTAPGDPNLNGGIGTLTLSGVNSARAMCAFESGGTFALQLAASSNDKVALISGQASDIYFNNNVINFTDTTAGGLATGQYVLFTADVSGAYSGLTTDGSGFITAGLSIGTGLSSYTGLSLQVVGNNIVLNLTAPAGPPPAAPTGLVVVSNFAAVSLVWNTTATASSYKVYRSTTSGSGYAQIASGVSATNYTDTTALIGSTYYYVVSAVNPNGEGANSSEVSTTVQGRGVSINLKPAADTGMTAGDVAGVARLGKWLNLDASSSANTKSILTDNTGAAVAGTTTTFTGGNASGALTINTGDTGNDATLIKTVYDQFDGTASTITVSNIPYATYDLYLYRYDDSSTRAGSFQVNGGTTYYMRGGSGNPTSGGTGYVRSTDTTFGAGTDIDQGNYIRVTNLTGSSLTVSIVAVNAGDSVQRCKFAGYQIVATTDPGTPVAVPPAPTNVLSTAGNNSVTVYWSGVSGATNYTVKRATAPGGPYTTTFSVSAGNNSYADSTAGNGTNYYYVVSAWNVVGEGANSAETSATPYDPALVRAISVNITPIYGFGMAWADVAGIRRVDHWNNFVGPVWTNQTVTLASAKDNLGAVQSGFSASLTAGTTGTGYDYNGTVRLDSSGAVISSGTETEFNGGNEVNLYTSVYDQYGGVAATLAVTNVPYTNYDVVIYIRSDASTPTRGGSITLGGVAKYIRNGAGNVSSNGLGYVESTATANAGSGTMQGNYVRFAGISSNNFTATMVAENMGDSTMRLKVAGFQIISNDPVTNTPPVVAPAVPANVAAYAGNAQVSVTWSASATATNYIVKRNGNLLTNVSAPKLDSPTAYVDAAVTNGTTYSYTVAAQNSAGTSADSTGTNATPQLPGSFEAPLPAEWQYTLPVTPLQSDYTTTVTNDPERRAFLWIPPGCTQVRAVMFCIMNMVELKMLESSSLRAALASNNIAIVWVSFGAGAVMDLNQDPSNGPQPVSNAANNFGDKAGQAAVEVARLLTQFAAESGYSEIQYCPIISFQHSASSPFGWTREVYAKPALNGRVVSILNKGFYPGNAPRGIPSIHLTSEWAENAVTWSTVAGDPPVERKLRAQQGTTAGSQNTSSTQALFGELMQVGEGHYQSDFMSDSTSQPLFIDFIIKTAQQRLPAVWDGASYPALTELDHTNGGFIDVTKTYSGSAAAVTFDQWVAAHPDDPQAKRAFWYPDLAYAQAMAAYANAGFNKTPQFVTPINPDGSFQNLFGVIGAAEYYPTIQSDGVTFSVKAGNTTTSPSFRQFNAGPVTIGSAPIKYIHSSGALRQVGPDRFQMWVDRGEIQHQSLPWDNFIIAYNRGDATHRAVDRPLHINIPILNTTGAAQTLTFPTIPNQVATNLTNIVLAATASSGLPVQYWMNCGPYLLTNSTLPNSTMTPQPLPVRATYPMRVMVGAYQWGTRAGTQYKASAPAYQTFWIFRDAVQKWQYETFGTLTGGTNGAANDQATWTFNCTSPTVGADSRTGVSGLAEKVKIADLLTNDTANFGSLGFAGFANTTSNGLALTTDGTNIIVPAGTNADSFTYTVTNSMGCPATGTVSLAVVAAPAGQAQSVSVTGGVATVNFAGVPGYPYLIQRATNVLFTAGLRTWPTNAPAAGVFQIADSFSDLGGPPASAFYRLRYNP